MSLDNLSKLKRKNEVKKIKVNDVELYIRSFSALERAELLDIMEEKYGIVLDEIQKSTKNIHVTNKGVFEHMLYTVSFGLCDEKGIKLFEDKEEGFKVVNDLEGNVISKLNEEILKYNGMHKESKKEAIKN